MNALNISLGQHTDKGRKAINQDNYGAFIPKDSQLKLKGIIIALADGISSSDVSQDASKLAINNLLNDYYCTSEAWSVKHSALKVLKAINSWLFSQTSRSQHRFNKDKGWVCTISALVLKGRVAHLFHMGDSRIYRFNEDGLEQLTKDHRVWVSKEESYLRKALGIHPIAEIDYEQVTIKEGDIFILATDGVYEFLDNQMIQDTLNQNYDLNKAARILINHAFDKGSDDNLSMQLARIDQLPMESSNPIQDELTQLPYPPLLRVGQKFDGYTILEALHNSSRSHVYLAQDDHTQQKVVLKTPSVDIRESTEHMERFLTEEWIARRINNPHVLKPALIDRERSYLYTITEFIEGQNLAQWVTNNPNPSVERVRQIVTDIAKGLQAFHRMEMLHQDLKPENIIITETGKAVIIDFGSTWVAGLAEQNNKSPTEILGTALYSAPEYFLGQPGSNRSELYSLGVLTYYLLSGRFPYGTQVAGSRTKKSQLKLKYRSVLRDDRAIPAWIDEAIKKAVHVIPHKRHDEISEFLYDLKYPNQMYLSNSLPPLLERNPVMFWQGVSFFLAIALLLLLFKHHL